MLNLRNNKTLISKLKFGKFKLIFECPSGLYSMKYLNAAEGFAALKSLDLESCFFLII
jgi:hypothetical protein